MPNANSHITLPFSKSHAFIIGIDEYEHVSPLRTAVNDAIEIAEVLRTHHGFTVHGPLLNPGKEETLRYLEKTMLSEVGEEDRVFFYFAGHGIALESSAGPNGYLVPADAQRDSVESLIPMNKIDDLIDKLDCKHGLLVFDCCFAGAFKWSSGRRDVIMDLPGLIYEERFYQYARDPAWQVLTSSASDQKAVDIMGDRILGFRDDDDSPNSPFAQALMDGLMGEADIIPRDGGDGVITATELYTYLRDRVEDETTEHATRQTPSIFTLGKHDKGQFIFLHPKHRLNLPPMPKRNPFMGLKSFNEEDQPYFYGRDRVIEALASKILDSPLTVVCGASGTGKSSVIKAGLIPLMRQQGWKILPTLRPGQEPMEVLQSEIPDINLFIDQFTPSLLVIDQYEELVTQCLHEWERKAFEAELAKWIQAYPLLRIVISIRADFEPQFSQSALAQHWEPGRYVIPTFNSSELREIIIKPTFQEVLFFEPSSLVEDLLDSVSQTPGALPLLSFTLSELYFAYIRSARTNRSLTKGDYEKLGGVIGALSMSANKIYDALDFDHQRTMRKFMLRVVYYDGEKLASRRVLANQLIYSDEEETERMFKIANTLVDERLFSTGIDEENDVYYEPVHDALIHSWLRLQQWILVRGKSKLVLKYNLTLALADYQENIKSPKAKKYLWDQNPRLNEIYEELTSGDHNLNNDEEDFIRKSRKRREGKKQRMQTWIGASAAVLFIAFGISVIQWITLQQQTNSLLKAQQTGMSNLADLMVSKDMNIASKIAAEAYAMDSTTVLGHSSLLKTAYKPPIGNANYVKLKKKSSRSQIIFKAFLSGGKRIQGIEINGSERRIHIWNCETGLLDEESPKYAIEHLDGGSRKRIDDQALPSNLSAIKNTFRSFTFSRDKKKILALYGNGSLNVFDKNGKLIASLSSISPCESAYFSPNSRYIAAEHFDGNIRIWDLNNLENEKTALQSHTLSSAVNAIAISPDGNRIAATDDKGNAAIHTLLNRDTSVCLNAPSLTKINSMDFSPDGKTLLTGGDDKKIHTWDLTGSQMTSSDTLPEKIRKAKFSPDGKSIIVISFTSLNVLDRKGRPLKSSVYYGRDNESQHHYEIGDFSFSPTGDTLTTVTFWADGARRWNFSNQDFGRPLNGSENKKLETNLTDKGITSTSNDGSRFLLNNVSNKELLVFDNSEELLFIHKNYFATPIKAVFSPNNHFVICAFSDHSVKILNESLEEIISFFPHKSPITALEVDPKGNYFVTASADSTVKIWPLSPTFLKKSMGNKEKQSLSVLEKIAFLNYQVDQFHQDSIKGKALDAARYLDQKGRVSEARRFFQLVEKHDGLSIAEKYKYKNFNAANFLQSNDYAELLSSARFFHQKGKPVAAEKLFKKAATIEDAMKHIKTEEKINYLGFNSNYFEQIEDKWEVLDAARFYIASDTVVGKKLFKRAELLHGACNWKALTPLERDEYLGYDLGEFIEGNTEIIDLSLIKEYYSYKTDTNGMFLLEKALKNAQYQAQGKSKARNARFGK